MRLTLASTHPRLGDKAHNLAEMERIVSAAQGDLVVFPEMALTGYLIGDRVNRLAERIDGATVSRIVDLAANTERSVLFGFPREDDTRAGLVYNSAALVDPDGGVQYYDKRHLATFGPFQDGIHFTPGRDLGLFETSEATLGVSICYDLFFPELHKAMALEGADILLNISASPNTSRRFFEMMFPARAVENTVPFVYTNFAGTQDDLVFWGGPQYWSPRGKLKDRGPYFEPSVLEIDVDLDEARAARPLRPTLRDSRPDVARDLYRSMDPDAATL